VREAHPEKLQEGNQTGIVGNPKDLRERVILATQCVSQYKFTIPMVLDGMDGRVNRDYDAAPVRVTVVDIDGKVAFYAGRGPADFRIPPVEQTLKKLIAHQGRLPPAPPLQWGQAVNGLRCGIRFDPPTLVLGQEAAVTVAFQNTSDTPIALRYEPREALRQIVVRNDNGQTLKLEMRDTERQAGPNRGMPRPNRAPAVTEIRPGQSFEAEILAKVTAASDAAVTGTRSFAAVLHWVIDKDMRAEADSVRPRPLWTGKTASGTCILTVSSPQPARPKD